MAGDWIKMRVDLLTSPKVVRMASALNADRFKIVGGLLSVWSLFDAHSEDGILFGYSADMLDQLGAWPGFSSAMMAVGWLNDNGQTLELPRFDAHNGASAKRRAQDADRKREFRKTSVIEADKIGTREEKRREEKISNTNVLDINTSAQAPPRKNKNDYPDWFNELMLEYPPRAGSNDKRRAFQACNARIADGYTPDAILQAVTRYRFWVLATGKLNTEFVMQTATFCGPGGHLDNQWVIGAQVQPQVYCGGVGSTKSTPIQQQLDDRSWVLDPVLFEPQKQESPLPGEFNLIQQQD